MKQNKLEENLRLKNDPIVKLRNSRQLLSFINEYRKEYMDLYKQYSDHYDSILKIQKNMLELHKECLAILKLNELPSDLFEETLMPQKEEAKHYMTDLPSLPSEQTVVKWNKEKNLTKLKKLDKLADGINQIFDLIEKDYADLGFLITVRLSEVQLRLARNVNKLTELILVDNESCHEETLTYNILSNKKIRIEKPVFTTVVLASSANSIRTNTITLSQSGLISRSACTFFNSSLKTPDKLVQDISSLPTEFRKRKCN